MARRGDAPDDRYDDDYNDDFEGRRPRRRGRDSRSPGRERPPFLLRFFSWIGIILLCFVAGYLGTSWMVRSLNTRSLLKPENRVENGEDLKALTEPLGLRKGSLSPPQEWCKAKAALSGVRGDIQQVSLRLYFLKNGGLAEDVRPFLARPQEDNIRDAVQTLLAMSGIEGAESNVRVLHVFRSADTVYLDCSRGFAAALSKLGQRNSQFLVTGIVRTMQDNFPPIVKVRFLIDGAVSSGGAPIDLTVPWQLPRA